MAWGLPAGAKAKKSPVKLPSVIGVSSYEKDGRFHDADHVW